MHFDILEPEAHKQVYTLLNHGRRYVAGDVVPKATVTAKALRVCHMESADESASNEEGISIPEFGNCD